MLSVTVEYSSTLAIHAVYTSATLLPSLLQLLLALFTGRRDASLYVGFRSLNVKNRVTGPKIADLPSGQEAAVISSTITTPYNDLAH